MRIGFAVALLATTALVAVAATCNLQDATDSQSQLPATDQLPPNWRTHVPTFFPTPGPTFPWEHPFFGGGVADTPEEAASFARAYLTTPPPLITSRLDSLRFVETTLTAARSRFDPEGINKSWEDDGTGAAYLFVARGQFAFANRFSSTPPPTFDTYCIVIARGQDGGFATCCGSDIDISEIGPVRSVVLPLPDFPTPVSIEAAEVAPNAP